MSLFTNYAKIPTLELIGWLSLITIEQIENDRMGYYLNYVANLRLERRIERELKRRHIDRNGASVD